MVVLGRVDCRCTMSNGFVDRGHKVTRGPVCFKREAKKQCNGLVHVVSILVEWVLEVL